MLTRRRTLPVLLTLLSLLPAKSALAIGFEHISLGQGLSQSSVFAIAQDHEGFLWFGTQDGLDRYDGYTFRVFRNDPSDSTSVSYNYIYRLMVSRDGSVWVGTLGGGVSVYNQITGRFTQYLHKPGDPNSLSNNRIHALYQDRSGTIWVGTRYGLDRFDSSNGTFRRYIFHGTDTDTSREDFVSAVFEDRENRLWVGTINGADILNEKTGSVTELPPRGQVINKIIQTRGGKILFVGTGIWEYDPAAGALVPWKKKLTDQIEPNIGSDAALLNSNGTMWVGSYDGLGLIGIDSDTLAAFRHNPEDPTSLSENTVLSLCKDKSGILWVGTYEGINKYVPTKKKFNYWTSNPRNPNSLSNIRVRSFAEDSHGMIWIATQGGLDRFDPADQKFKWYFGRTGVSPVGPELIFWSVLVNRLDRNVSVWGGTNGQGIYVLTFKPGHKEPDVRHIALTMPVYKTTFSDVVNSLYQDREGNIWAGVYQGVIELIRSGNHYVQNRFPFPQAVNVIFQDSSGEMWIGGYSLRLHKYDKASGSFVRVFRDSAFANTIAGKSVLSMAEGKDGVLWVGTYGGLLKLTPAGKLIAYITVKDGLPNNVIYAILIDRHGNLWLSTDKGICRYSPGTGKTKDYTQYDGLQSNEFNQGSAMVSRRGEFYFGGINGFNSFYPDSIHDNPNIPSVVFTGLKIFNKSVEPGPPGSPLTQTIWTAPSTRLNFSEAVLTFDFAALEYTEPQRNMYAYKLIGFDKHWVDIGNRREVTYTNLDPGKYILRVRASNNDGVWNNQGASLNVYISPPLWMTWWFRSLFILLFLSIGPIIYYRRVTTLKKEAAIQREFARRLIESQESERSRIAAELHDTIGQDLLVIKNRAFLAQRAKRLNSNVKLQLDNIAETVTQSLQDVRGIVRNLRPYHLERIGLTGALKAMLESVTQSARIHFDVSVENIDGMIADGSKESETSFFRIVQECVNNLLKHSEARNASVIISRSGMKITAVISDDGRGFDYDSVHEGGSNAGLGLSSMSERARMIGGTLSIQSQMGRGTTVTLIVPERPDTVPKGEGQT